MIENPYEAPGANVDTADGTIRRIPKFFLPWLLFFFIISISDVLIGMLVVFVYSHDMIWSGEMISLRNLGLLIRFALALPISFFTFKFVVSKYILRERA